MKNNWKKIFKEQFPMLRSDESKIIKFIENVVNNKWREDGRRAGKKEKKNYG